MTHDNLTKQEIDDWLNYELDKIFPEPKDLISEMDLDVQFRDVTYETLKEEGFYAKLCEAYPRVDWDKPFNEFNAAKEREE